MIDIPAEDVRVDVFTNMAGQTIRLTHIPTATVVTLDCDNMSQRRCKAEALRLLKEQLGPPGEPDATNVDPEDLLRRWFHWWRTSADMPATPDDGLHISTAAFLTARAVEDGRKIYGPQSL